MLRTTLLLVLLLHTTPLLAAPSLTFCCSPQNDLYLALNTAGAKVPRFDSPTDAAARAPDNSALLVLADAYPARRTQLDDAFFATATKKHLRLYLEFPSAVPGVDFGKPTQAAWERVVIASDAAGKALPRLRILNAHACTFLPVAAGASDPLLVIARVAGFDSAVYGLPKTATPLLFQVPDRPWWIAGTKLSNVSTGRYGPTADWQAVWQFILTQLEPQNSPDVRFKPAVHPAYGPTDALPADAESAACRAAANWYLDAGLLVHATREAEIHRLLLSGAENLPAGDPGPPGDGSRGILEGFASQIFPDGSQPRRIPLRLDCNAESAMVLALEHWRATNDGDGDRTRTVSTHLLDYVHFNAPSHRGPRGNPKHPAFGLVAWGEIAPAWTVGNYGDDNARALLATIAGAAALKTDRYDVPVLRALLANLRTTGKLGFRGDRVDVPALEKLGWRHFHDAAIVNYSPHFESGLWACYLWAHARTGEAEFLDKATTAIRMTMAVYPKGWRWKDNLERARMVLCLAWLVRVQDTPEHRGWLTAVATDLLKSQQPSGALRERIVGIRDGGHYSVPVSNEAYGTTETPLQQSPDDPVTDQLYTTGFALLGLHEAAAATNDANLKRAEDALAAYLVRIQVRADGRPDLNGAWFRAFDDRAWAYRASSADVGWGAWCLEAGWGQAWAAATIALRQQQTNLWDLTAGSSIAKQSDAVRNEMARNDGGPWTR
jgi:hypothetical protein